MACSNQLIGGWQTNGVLILRWAGDGCHHRCLPPVFGTINRPTG